MRNKKETTQKLYMNKNCVVQGNVSCIPLHIKGTYRWPEEKGINVWKSMYQLMEECASILGSAHIEDLMNIY